MEILWIGLAGSLINTATIISAITMVLPTLLVLVPIFTRNPFPTTLDLLGGSIALLIGERFEVLKDRYVMKRWIRLQHYLIVLNGATFVLWSIMYPSEVFS